MEKNKGDMIQGKDFMTSLVERATQNQTLLSMSEDAQKITRMSDPEAAAFIGKSHSTLAHARSEQSALGESDRDLASCGCIPHIPGQPIQYRLYDLLIYKANEGAVTGVSKSRSLEAKKKTAVTVDANAQKRELKEKASGEAAKNASYRGLSAFMQTATAADTWPFSMQKDGRPMDLYAAILDGKLTGQAERLNLREFANRLADAANKSYSDEGAKGIDSDTPPARNSGEEKARTDRWNKPGGPV